MSSMQLGNVTLDELVDTYGTDDLSEIADRISEEYDEYDDQLDEYSDLDFGD